MPRAGDYGYTQYTLMIGQGTVAVDEDGWGGSTSLLSVEVMSPAWSVMTNLHARRGCRGPWRWHHGTAAVPLWPLAIVAWIMLLRRSGPILIPPDSSICERCGYPLQGITIDRCPECGEPVRVPSS